MTILNFIMALGGLGIFLFALRTLTQGLDEAISIKIRPFLKKLNQHTLLPIFGGVGLTVILQASSIGLLSTMGFLAKNLISFETAYFLMIGATIGTSIKSFFFITSIEGMGAGIIFITSFILLFARHHVFRKILEILLSIGLMYLGWEILGNSLKPILNYPPVVNYLAKLNDQGMINIFIGIFTGLVLTATIQSSSTIIFLILGLAMKGLIPFLVGVYLILGANIGTTITGILASFEYQKSVKRLALAHFLVKFIGVFMTVLTLKSFLNAVDILFMANSKMMNISEKLAMVHFGFNILNGMIWTLLSPIIIKLSKIMIKGSNIKSKDFLNSSLINLLTQVPEEGLLEIKKEWWDMKNKVKIYEDSLINPLLNIPNKPIKISIDDIKKNIVAMEEILIGIMIHHKKYRREASCHLTRIGQMKLIFEEIHILKNQLYSLPKSKIQFFSKVFNRHLEKINEKRNELWLSILADKKVKVRTINSKILHEIEEQIVHLCNSSHHVSKEDMVMIYHLLNTLLGHTQRLIGLVAQKNRPETSEPPSKKPSTCPAIHQKTQLYSPDELFTEKS